MSRVKNSAVISRQLPEHIREDYPTFVAFVEAYYEYLQNQGVDFSTIRDIDKTLDEFVVNFKKELAFNLPNVFTDERFLIQKIKDHYLSKGSEASYKLLFKLLFGKEVELVYPSASLLRASDGKWNQEQSLFAKVDFGDPEDVVGKLVDIQTPTKVLRVLVDRRQDIVGEIDRIISLGGNIYEFFLDKSFFGDVNPGDKITYRDEFSATILPSTVSLTISQPGKGFRAGQVFELRSGSGTGALMKVIETTPTGGIKYAEFIKFGIGYLSDFAVSVLSTNSVTTVGPTANALSSFSRDGNNLFLTDRFVGFDEQGYINSSDYFEINYVDGTYVGTLLREFILNYRNSQLESDEPAVVLIKIGALSKYPGYFESNNGFLDDSIVIQDSKYYQAFSYVLKIDERIDSYRSAVKTMVHPAGMLMFGEYNITNNYDLSVDLTSEVKSLGITLDRDNITTVDTLNPFSITKILSDSSSILDNSVVALLFSVDADDFITIDNTFIELSKLFHEDVSCSDSLNNIIVNLLLNDQIFQQDSIISTSTDFVLEDSFEVLDAQTTNNVFYRNYESALTNIDDISSNYFYKSLSNSIDNIDDNIDELSIVYGLELSSNVSLNENISSLLLNITLDDEPQIAENIGKETQFGLMTKICNFNENTYLTIEPYNLEDYFLEHYANDRTEVGYYQRCLTENIDILENVEASKIFPILISDSISVLCDISTIGTSKSISISESFSVVEILDNVSLVFNDITNLDDNVSTIDTFSLFLNGNIVINNGLGGDLQEGSGYIDLEEGNGTADLN